MVCRNTVRNPWRGVDAGGGDGGVPRLTDSSAAIVYYTVKRALVEAQQAAAGPSPRFYGGALVEARQAAGGPLSEALRRCLSRGAAAGLSMCEGFFAAATPFCFVFRRHHAIFFSFLFRGPAISFRGPAAARPFRFVSFLRSSPGIRGTQLILQREMKTL